MQLSHLLKKVFVLALLAATSAYALPKGACDRTQSGSAYSKSSTGDFSSTTSCDPCAPDPCDPCYVEDTNPCCEEPKPGPFAFTFPKDMNLVCPGDFYFKVDFLAMQPKEEGLEYAVRNTNLRGVPLQGGQILGFSSGDSDLETSRNWDWGLGFRIGAGAYFQRDAWVLDFQYTWFKINEEMTSIALAGEYLIPLWLSPFAIDSVPLQTLTPASSRWHLSMNMFDLTLGKPFHVSRYLIMSPFFGLKGGWINQKIIQRYSGDFLNNNTNVGVKVQNKNDYWGIGTKFGINTEWLITCGWKLLANWSTSMLYGNFDVTQEAAVNTSKGNLSYRLKHDFNIDKPNMEYQIGIGWGRHFQNQSYHFGFQVMWEFQQWWDQNNLRKLYQDDVTAAAWANDTVSRGDLTLSGVSVRMIFDF